MYFFVLFLLLSTAAILKFIRTKTRDIGGPRVFLAANFRKNAAKTRLFGMVSDVLNMQQIPNMNNQSIESVRCCWNGLVVLKSSPFYQGLSFRSKFPGECGASECSLTTYSNMKYENPYS